MHKLRPNFWNDIPLEQLTRPEWEALCDGCGKCCLNKLEDEDTGEVYTTRVACRLFDDETCQCGQYPIRHNFVPECIVLTMETLAQNLYWLPQTCAYRLRYEKRPLYDWHPLIAGRASSVHEAGISMRGRTLPEFEIDPDDWENYLLDEEV